MDGIADCADAWVGGIGNRERTLEIMKDPRCGAMAVVAVVTIMHLKLSALIFVLQAEAGQLLVLAPLLARMSVVLLFTSTDYVGSGPIGQALTALSKNRILFMLVIWVSLSGMLFSLDLLMATLAVAIVVHLILTHYSKKRLQGFTGDCAGALIEFTEIAVLLIGGMYLS